MRLGTIDVLNDLVVPSLVVDVLYDLVVPSLTIDVLYDYLLIGSKSHCSCSL